MRAYVSYGIALLIVLGLAIWLGTGVLIQGGQGPGQGETTIVGGAATSLTAEQQALVDEAAAKQAAADAAKKAADDAAAAATAAAEAADAADTAGLAEQEKLKTEAEERAKAAEEAKKAEEAAIAATKAADEAARAAQDAADAFRSITQRTQGEDEDVPPPPRSVRIEISTAQAKTIEVPLRGRTKAVAAVSVVAQTSGTVQAVSVTKGQSVKAGDLLCTLDQGARQAAVAQAQASVDQAQSSYDANAALREKGLAAENSGLPLEAALKGAQAALQNAQLEFERTVIKSPVDGVVADPLVTVGSMLAPGAPCASVVQLDPMLFVAAVPEARINYAKLGLKAAVTTVTGDKAEGTVTYLSPTADEATRSFAVEISLPNADLKIRDGVTADAIVNVGTTTVHVLPQSVLTLDDDGVLGIRTVEAGNKVAFYPATIMKDSTEGVWLAGLPFKINVITVGQDFVQPGQVVDAKTAEGEQPS